MATIDERRRAILANLMQPAPPAAIQRQPVPVSIPQSAPVAAPPRQVTPVSLPAPIVPDRTGLAIQGGVYGDMTGMGQTPQPLTPLQAADIRTRANAAVQ